MKAIICTKSGPPEVLQLTEVPKPAPRDNEILVKILASSVTSGDVISRKIPRLLFSIMGLFFGFKASKITGHELAGEVESVGKKVTLFKPGDQVFGTTSGLSVGSNAEYVCLPEKRRRGVGVVAIRPANLSYLEAAAVPIGGMTALFLLRRANIQQGQKVLIYGASGSVGTYAVQLARHFGAEVTGVCSTRNIKLVRSLGAAQVIDYTREEFARPGEAYDVIFDAVGKITQAECKKVLKARGAYLSVKSPTKEILDDLMTLKALVEAEELKPVIDKKYPLEKTVEAHQYVEKGHKAGNVVITVNHAQS